jgi:ribosomal protein S18 acetylase RimI-like enzyme
MARSRARILVSRCESEDRVVDIDIMRRHQGSDVGTRLLRLLAEEASRARKPLRLTLAVSNRAVGLYRRIGFEVVSSDGANVGMEIAAPPN